MAHLGRPPQNGASARGAPPRPCPRPGHLSAGPWREGSPCRPCLSTAMGKRNTKLSVRGLFINQGFFGTWALRTFWGAEGPEKSPPKSCPGQHPSINFGATGQGPRVLEAQVRSSDGIWPLVKPRAFRARAPERALSHPRDAFQVSPKAGGQGVYSKLSEAKTGGYRTCCGLDFPATNKWYPIQRKGFLSRTQRWQPVFPPSRQPIWLEVKQANRHGCVSKC